MFQVKIGIRNMVMPGRAHADDRGDEVDRAEEGADTGHVEAHDPQVTADAGRVDALLSGAYANQPKLAAPPGRRKPETAISPPNR